LDTAFNSIGEMNPNDINLPVMCNKVQSVSSAQSDYEIEMQTQNGYQNNIQTKGNDDEYEYYEYYDDYQTKGANDDGQYHPNVSVTYSHLVAWTTVVSQWINVCETEWMLWSHVSCATVKD